MSKPKHRLPIAPTPPDVLYAPPNIDGTRKQCENCFLYLFMDERCLIHAADLAIHPLAVCGYHVEGAPLRARPAKMLAIPLDPKLTGLILTDRGTSCDLCSWYEKKTKDKGLCHGVMVDGKPASVDALGCCARWASRTS